MEEINKRKKENFAIDMFLSLMGGENGIVDFKIVKIDKENKDIFFNIMENINFLSLDEEHPIKQTLLKFEEESNKFLKQLYEKVEKLGD